MTKCFFLPLFSNTWKTIDDIDITSFALIIHNFKYAEIHIREAKNSLIIISYKRISSNISLYVAKGYTNFYSVTVSI